MKSSWIFPVCWLLLLVGCQSSPDKTTIAKLRQVDPDMTEVAIDDSLVKAMNSYQRFLNETPGHAMAPEAMRRLADLQIEKEYGIIGDGAPPSVIELPAPERSTVAASSVETPPATERRDAQPVESDVEFERRATAPDALASRQRVADARSHPEDVEAPTPTPPARVGAAHQSDLPTAYAIENAPRKRCQIYFPEGKINLTPFLKVRTSNVRVWRVA